MSEIQFRESLYFEKVTCARLRLEQEMVDREARLYKARKAKEKFEREFLSKRKFLS